jgi:hypothetical protein
MINDDEGARVGAVFALDLEYEGLLPVLVGLAVDAPVTSSNGT